MDYLTRGTKRGMTTGQISLISKQVFIFMKGCLYPTKNLTGIILLLGFIFYIRVYTT